MSSTTTTTRMVSSDVLMLEELGTHRRGVLPSKSVAESLDGTYVDGDSCNLHNLKLERNETKGGKCPSAHTLK